MAAKTDAIRKLVEERLAELDEERTQLVDALAALDGRKGPGRPRGSGGSGRRSKNPSRSSNAPRPGRRRRKGGTRAEHAEKAITAEPGITASQVAEQLKIKPNYVYRVMADLVKEGRIEKKGTGYYPPGSGSQSEAPAADGSEA
ncbi:MAG: winged helix-turn-helix domain-containing protein [Actinomycetota bacterium]|nr:winged helix-turn-helix domain-containing protein [Actinomycetota bacterium]